MHCFAVLPVTSQSSLPALGSRKASLSALPHLLPAANDDMDAPGGRGIVAL